MSENRRICAVLASDAKFFHQTRAAIDSIRRADQGDLDIRLIAIGPFDAADLAWLAERNVTVFDRLDDIPRFNDGPAYAVALSCRPYLPRLFPEYDGYIWIDSDIRMIDRRGLLPWIMHARNPQVTIAIAQESEATYTINAEPERARNYHRFAKVRMRGLYGRDVARHFQYFKFYNAGLFAMPAESPVWDRYRANLELVLNLPFHHLREQDALNVAIAQSDTVWTMASTWNWLCSLAMPVRSPGGGWMPPDNSDRRIKVAHLTDSGNFIMHKEQWISYYEYYRLLGLAEPEL